MIIAPSLYAKIDSFAKDDWRVFLLGEGTAILAYLGKYKTGKDYYWSEFKYSKIFKTERAALKALDTMLPKAKIVAISS